MNTCSAKPWKPEASVRYWAGMLLTRVILSDGEEGEDLLRAGNRSRGLIRTVQIEYAELGHRSAEIPARL